MGHTFLISSSTISFSVSKNAAADIQINTIDADSVPTSAGELWHYYLEQAPGEFVAHVTSAV
jgi:hypothetical protein